MANSSVRLINNTTSTGFGVDVEGNPIVASIEPSQTFTAQVATVAGTTSVATFRVQGSLDGVTWADVIAASTVAGGTRTVSSTSVHIYTNLRAEFTSHPTTEAMTLWVVGR